MTPRPNASFGQTPWTVRTPHTRRAPARAGAAAGIRGRAADARPRLGARASARAGVVHEEVERGLVALFPTMPTRVMPRKRRVGSSATSRWRSCRRAVCAGAPGSSRHRIWSESARGRSRCSRPAGSSARRQPPSPRACHRPPSGRRRSVFGPATSRGSNRSPSTSPRRVTSGSSVWRSGGSSPSAAA